ncbi:flagellum-associated coiled-coil domain-containing protein 1-like isoform X2 [Biomphalaria glabrata]|uniref:Flagellum-associated coiled-coil domain-containing protein 1-like isoform X2 n=1 Tax=Biomphalaria glabrata TaxID=6526 RepID=A0A9W2Z6K8_BIOGL|nr:flagellum-associated coiled-coil domain-containing protein 1-like isoform X2 [Biomphalaria glabrata]
MRSGSSFYSNMTSSPLASRQSTSMHSSTINRPKTAIVIPGRSECDRLHQLEHEPTRRHNFENHLPLKRAKPPPWQRMLESPLVPFQTGPGYILTRSKSKFHVTIKDEFFDQTSEDARKKSYADPERDSLIGQLQQQISDLTLYLEEERLNHKQTKQKAEEFLKDRLEQVNSLHQEQVRDLEADHEDKMKKEIQRLNDQHKEVQTTLEKQISKLVKEIEFLQGAFESYKSTLHSESIDKLKAKEDELRLKLEEEKQQALHDLKTKYIQERNQERTQTAKEHKKAIDAIRQENKKEMDGLLKRFSNAAADLEKLKKTTAELEETKAELAEVKASYESACQQLNTNASLLTDAKIRLNEFEERFQEKVALVDDKYRHRLEELLTQNAELKRMFVQKCEDLYNEKTQSEQRTQQKLKSAKEVMETLIKSKQRANVSVILGGPPYVITERKHRPSSAPGTKWETQTAHLGAGNLVSKTRHHEFVSPDIVMEMNPETEVLRAELFSSPQNVSR